MTNLINILKAREIRVAYQQQLLALFGGTLVMIHANYPGSQKDTPATRYVVSLMMERIKDTYELTHLASTTTCEGLIYYCLCKESGTSMKQAMMALEESHPLGRLVDLDVYDQEKAYSRSEFQKTPRACFVCAKEAHLCSRSARHPQETLIAYYEGLTAAFQQKGECKDDH